MKICTKCKKYKKLKKFDKDKNTKSGLQCWCKLCRKNYYQNNKEKIKKYRQKYPWKSTFRHVRDRCNNSKNLRYKDYGGRGIKCLITLEELKQLWFRDKAWLLKKPSIDRINNDGHYCLENCRFIEMVDNVKKSHIDNPHNKVVLQYDKQGNFIKEWESGTEAGEKLKISNSNITQCIKGKYKTSGGYIWKYKEVKSRKRKTKTSFIYNEKNNKKRKGYNGNK